MQDSVTYVESFTYDGLGRMLTADKVIDETNPTPDTQISEITFAYNDLGQVTDFDQALFGGTTRTMDYTFDQAGYLTATTYPDSTVINRINDWQERIELVTEDFDHWLNCEAY
ncbi:MAG: hypothetical protein JXA82_16655 [Sedimentisphaerales bacterium]|nr:hypothetical protein [Sedimentisphaerales bacterium]